MTCPRPALISLAAASVLFAACSGAPDAPGSVTVSAQAQDAVPAAEDQPRVRLHGTVEAVRARAVMVPRLAGQPPTQLVITYLIEPGARVQAGQRVVELDRQLQVQAALDRRAEVADLDAQIDRKLAEQMAARAKDETELKKAEHDVERAKLEVLKNPLLPRVEAEKNTLALEQAEAQFKRLRTSFELKRQAAAADVRILEIRRERAEKAREYAERNIELMAVEAPFEGLAVIKTMYRSGNFVELQTGDEVRPGVPILSVVDTSKMQVRASINQADLGIVRVGMPATIRLDGFPELEFQGRVETIAPIATTSQLTETVKSFTTVVSIVGSHPQLMPDLTASVEIAGDPASKERR